jgi:hypothetical protein
MRIFSAKSVVALATLAGASASGRARVSIPQENPGPVLATRAHIDASRPAGSHYGLHATSLNATTPVARRTVAEVTEPSAVMDPTPEQEKANMGMMILVGLAWWAPRCSKRPVLMPTASGLGPVSCAFANATGRLQADGLTRSLPVGDRLAVASGPTGS